MSSGRSLQSARSAVLRVTTAILETADDALPNQFDWRGAQLEFRHGFFALIEHVERSQAESSAGSSASGLIAGQVSAARWALRGALLPFTDSDLDRAPAEGEWPLRTTLTHVVKAQEWWTWMAEYWAERLAAGEKPGYLPREILPAKFKDVDQSDLGGGIADFLKRIDTLVDAALAPLLALEEHHATPVRFRGVEVRLDFYPYRWTQHLREHTVQVDKSAALLAREPTEQQRIARLLLEAFGRLEGPFLTGAATGLEGRLATFNAEAGSLFAEGPSQPRPAPAARASGPGTSDNRSSP